MIKKKSVIEVVTEANQELAATLADLRAKLKEEEERQATADAKAEEAINSGNADAYTKAKNASRTAADKIEFYNIQIKNKETAPLFKDPTDREEKAAEIIKSYKEYKAEKMKKAAQLLKEAKTLVEDVQAEIKKDNAALNILVKNTDSGANSIDAMRSARLLRYINEALSHSDIENYVKS